MQGLGLQKCKKTVPALKELTKEERTKFHRNLRPQADAEPQLWNSREHGEKHGLKDELRLQGPHLFGGVTNAALAEDILNQGEQTVTTKSKRKPWPLSKQQLKKC